MFRYLSAATSSGPFRGWFRSGQASRGGQREEEKKQEEEETRGGGGGSVVIFSGERPTTTGAGQRLGWWNAHSYDSISPFPSPLSCSISCLNRQKYWSQRPVRKQLFPSRAIVPRTIDCIVAKERFEFTRPLEPSPRGKLRDALAPRALFEGI